MDHAELTQQRAVLWLRPVHSLEDARDFLSRVGFCLLYPVRPSVLAPTFIGAVLGTDQGLPIAGKASLDPRTHNATELVERLQREQAAFEVPFGDRGSLLIAAEDLPYFYALLGERNPKQPPSPGPRGDKSLLTHTFEQLQSGDSTEQQLLQRLGKSISESALARVLHELWAKMRVVRTGPTSWQLLNDCAPQLVRRGIQLSAGEAMSGLISRYLSAVVAAEPREIEEFFGALTARSKVMEMVKALLAAGEFQSVQIDGKRMITLTGAIPEPAPMKHLPGQAPPDLHESHKRNEVRRHRPERPRFVQPQFGASAAPPVRPEYPQPGNRPQGAERTAKPGDRFSRDRGTRPPGRPAQSRPGGKSERGGSDRPRRDRWHGDRPDRGVARPGRSKSESADRPRREPRPGERPDRAAGTSGRASRPFGKPKRNGSSFPSRSARPGGRPAPRRDGRPPGRKPQGPNMRGTRPQSPRSQGPKPEGPKE